MAKNNIENFIKREGRALATYTLDSSIKYVADENVQKFVFAPKKSTVYLPLTAFENNLTSDQMILWHIYYELAMYPDWKKNTDKYRNRRNEWKNEIESMTYHLIRKVKSCELENDSAYSQAALYNYVSKEVMEFLYYIDRYAGFIRVMELCPIYRAKEYRKEIGEYIRCTGINERKMKLLPVHKRFSKSFLLNEISPKDICLEQFGIDRDKNIFGMDYMTFIRKELKREVQNGEGIEVREDFVRSFIFPEFEMLWRKEIDEMSLYSSSGKESDDVRSERGKRTDESSNINIDISLEEQEKIIDEIGEDAGMCLCSTRIRLQKKEKR